MQRYFVRVGVMDCGDAEPETSYLCMLGHKLFCRDGIPPRAGFGENKTNEGELFDVTGIYCIVDPPVESLSQFRNLALHVPAKDLFKLQEANPESLWDHKDGMFMKPNTHFWVKYPMVLAMSFQAVFTSEPIMLVVLCDYRELAPSLGFFNGKIIPAKLHSPSRSSIGKIL
ncbi:hypothetical protein QQS21_008006 [Conoideocrella luteorostrata]|uniref:Uncharacterized protein n=1 Tax=Conoideocrella luteorostrata TaxID=1105319 RepID=A0AAJ0FZ15_9HYPO|nr:hypothetical protein QQS21_008006 [Conoideocrella luteorostrata]